MDENGMVIPYGVQMNCACPTIGNKPLVWVDML
jgi:hypothetical protein